MIRKFGVEIKWGSILAVIVLIWYYVEKALGYHDDRALYQPVFNFLVMLPMFVIYVMALRERREDTPGGQFPWLKAFVSSFIVTIVLALWQFAVQYILHNVISPNLLSNLKAARQTATHDAVVSDTLYTLEVAVREGIFGYISMGVLVGAIAALVVRRSVKSK